jgi:hypothetical protein
MKMTFVRHALGAVVGLVLCATGCSKSSTNGSEDTEDTTCETEDGSILPTAPEEQRVDLYDPVFSNPTTVTNALFPVSQQQRVLLLGEVDGERFRVEVTLLATPLVLEWEDHETATLVSQYLAYSDGRIEEVALDLYAQDDLGAVWYFGEDVFNYADGVVEDTDGTWHAGEEGGPAMIMPANPRLDDVWRPEDICGLVFEEVTTKSTGVTVQGPRGPIEGAVIVEELHDDGTFENKTFAPGYGEFLTDSGGDIEAVGLLLPIDALPGPVPETLATISTKANEVFAAAEASAWGTATSAMAELSGAWQAYAAGPTPPRLATQMNDATAALAVAVGADDTEATVHAALDVIAAALDFELRYRPILDIDLDLIDLWTRRLLLDLAADDRGAMLGDIATLGWIRHRIADDAVDRHAIDRALDALAAAAKAGDRPGAVHAANEVHVAAQLSARPLVSVADENERGPVGRVRVRLSPGLVGERRQP